MKKNRMMAAFVTAALAAGTLMRVPAMAEEQEVVEIFWQFPSINELGEGFYRMEDALNEMMEKDIGVHVTFVPTGLMESQQDATLMISSGEQLDVCMTAFTSLSNLVEKGLILPLDEYTDLIPDILELAPSKTQGCTYQGKLYGLPTCADPVFNQYGYLMKKQYADKYGFEIDDETVYTLDDLSEMFDTVAEGEGEGFYMFAPWNNTYEPLNYSYFPCCLLTGSYSGGVLMLNRDFKDLTVYDFFETEEYKELCERIYGWAQKGYVAQDAAIDSEYAYRAFQDNYLGNFGYVETTVDLLNTNDWNQEMVQLHIVPPHIKSIGCAINWNVPITSAHPDKAVEAINYLFKNVDAANLIQYGFEGEEYEIVEDNGSNQVIKFLAEDTSTLPYQNPYGLWGNRFAMYQVYPAAIDRMARQLETQESIPDELIVGASGYSFDSSSVSAEIAAVETVMEQYCLSFNAGSLNPDEALPEFIDALKAAGIDKIIAENQKQLDEWAALQAE